jgi:hypothetical protein
MIVEMIVEADPFVLYNGKSCEHHYNGDTKLTIDQSNYQCKIRSARIVQEGSATFGKENCPRITENR